MSERRNHSAPNLHEQIAAEYKRKQQLILLKKRPAHIAVEIISEVISQMSQPLLQVLGLVATLDAVDVEVHEPGQAVLVHGVDVGQVGDGEEEDGRVAGHWAVFEAGDFDCFLGFLGDGLLFGDLVRNGLKTREIVGQNQINAG